MVVARSGEDKVGAYCAKTAALFVACVNYSAGLLDPTVTEFRAEARLHADALLESVRDAAVAVAKAMRDGKRSNCGVIFRGIEPCENLLYDEQRKRRSTSEVAESIPRV